MKKTILSILIVFFLGVFLFSGWKVLSILLEYRKGQQTYAELTQYVSMPEPTAPLQTKATEADRVASDTTEEQTQLQPQPEEEKLPWPIVDFEALQQINPDVVGWIYIPDTNVNYPIVQGKNNDWYLHRLLSGEYNSSGSIFMEAGLPRDFTNANTPIYGHNMKNGTMFAGITGYKGQAFYDTHPTIFLMTPEKNYLVHVFSGYVVSSWGNAWDVTFAEDEFAGWLEEIQRKSYFASTVIPSPEDQIVTLSTCTYETDDVRFVVHGVLEEQK